MEIEQIKSDDIKVISNLLKDNNLPYEDIFTSKVTFITRKSEGKVIACIGTESYGEDALLRSFAVQHNFKSQGIGAKLLNELIEKCINEDIKVLHLLTTTAEKYFMKNGFLVSERQIAPIAIAHSKEFSALCPASSVYMRRRIA